MIEKSLSEIIVYYSPLLGVDRLGEIIQKSRKDFEKMQKDLRNEDPEEYFRLYKGYLERLLEGELKGYKV